MSSRFITENFLLQNDYAGELYHRFAHDLPIIDYHCHLSPAEVAEDRRFENLTQIWLSGDHYKWRAMRAAGVPERFCTGDASDWEKFQKWAEVVPQTLCNPLYHWAHLELKRPLGIADRLLGPQTAEGIWREGNARLAQPEFSARGIMRQMNVVLVCTTDDPTDTLEHHRAIAADPSFSVQVLPTFRPDRAMAVEVPEAFNAWTDLLAQRSGIEIGDHWDRYLEALHARHDFFHSIGCRLADHGLDTFYAADYTTADVAASLRAAQRQAARLGAAVQFKSALLYELAKMNAEKGWTQQFHIGALRNNNTRMYGSLGPDTGFDSIGDLEVARPMARFFNRLEAEGRLAKTIVYNLNPAQNEVVATMLGNFQDAQRPAKCSSAAPGGSWIKRTASRSNSLRCRTSAF